MANTTTSNRQRAASLRRTMLAKSTKVDRVARAIGAELEHDFDRLPWASQCYQYDRRTLRRIARAAIKALNN